MEVEEGLVGLQNSGKTEKVAPVSRRREIGLLSMMAVTLGSREFMVIGPGSPVLRQSLVLENQLGRRNIEGVSAPHLERWRGSPLPSGPPVSNEGC
jgi:hypothetical protein